MTRLNGAKIFTRLDIRQGFHRIRMHPESEDLTTFRCRYGTFKYKVMSFRVTNGPAYFQRFINNVMAEYLDNFMTIFVNDILIYSQNELEHQEHVKKILEQLQEAGLQAALYKCEFNVKRTKFLGFIISTNRVEVDPAKIQTILDWMVPTIV
jgi:ribosome-interacting GTPase 1